MRVGQGAVVGLDVEGQECRQAAEAVAPGFRHQHRRQLVGIERGAARLEKRGMKVIRVDMYGLFNELLADPQKFGVVDATAPCLLPTDPPRYCGSTVAQLLAFFDPVHPNATVHAAIADEVRGEVAPGPLPAPALMLLAALGALGLAARRRPETAAS